MRHALELYHDISSYENQTFTSHCKSLTDILFQDGDSHPIARHIFTSHCITATHIPLQNINSHPIVKHTFTDTCILSNEVRIPRLPTMSKVPTSRYRVEPTEIIVLSHSTITSRYLHPSVISSYDTSQTKAYIQTY